MTIVTISLTNQQTRENLCPKIAAAASSAMSRTARPRTPPSPAPRYCDRRIGEGRLEESLSSGRLRSFTTRARAAFISLHSSSALIRSIASRMTLPSGHMSRSNRVLSRRARRRSRSGHMHRPSHEPARRRARRERGVASAIERCRMDAEPGATLELIDPLQEGAKIRSKFLAHCGAQRAQTGRKRSENICLMSAAYRHGGDGASGASCRSAGRYRLETRL
jgi:hypothetical protein